MNKETDSKIKKNSVYSMTSAKRNYNSNEEDEDEFSWDYEFDDLDDLDDEYTGSRKTPNAGYVHKKQNGNDIKQKKKSNEKDTMSSLSLAALIFSIFGPFAIVGIILAVVDLAKKSREDKIKYNHSASVLAIVFGILWIIAGTVLAIVCFKPGSGEFDTEEYYEDEFALPDTYQEDEYVDEALEDYNAEADSMVYEFVPENPMTKGVYIAGSDFEVGKYTFKAYEGIGEIHIYRSKEEYDADSLEVGGLYSYHVKAENADKDAETPDYYTEYISNIDFSEGMCLSISGDVSVDRRGSLLDYSVSNITAGSYLVGEDIDAGIYDFIAANGFGDVCIYASRDAFLSDEHGLSSDETYHITEPSADLGQNSSDIFETYLSSLELSDGMLMLIKDSLVLEYGDGSGFDDLSFDSESMSGDAGLGIDSESANMDRNGGRTSSSSTGSSSSENSSSGSGYLGNNSSDSAEDFYNGYSESELEEAYQQIFDYYDENLKSYADDYIISSSDIPQESVDESYSIYQEAVSNMSGLLSEGIDEFNNLYSENGSSDKQYKNWCDKLNSRYEGYVNDVRNSLTYSIDGYI